MDALAAVAEEYSLLDTKLLEDEKNKGQPKHKAAAKDGDSSSEESILPGDSYSEDGTNCINPNDHSRDNVSTGASSGGLWEHNAEKLYTSGLQFRLIVKSWMDTIQESLPLEGQAFNTWVKYDNVMDSLTGELLRPPRVPEAFLDDQGTGDADFDERAAMQNANESCGLTRRGEPIPVPTQDDMPKKVAQDAQHETRFIHYPQAAAPKKDTVKPAVQPETKVVCGTFESKLVQPVQKSSIPSPRSPLLVPQAKPEPKTEPKPEITIESKAEGKTETIPTREQLTAAAAAAAATVTEHLASTQIVEVTEEHVEGMRAVCNEEVARSANAIAREPITVEGFRRSFNAGQKFRLPSFAAIHQGEDGEYVVGFVLVRPRHDVGFDGPVEAFCADCSIVVRKDFRNRGIGQQLLRKALLIFAANSFDKSYPKPQYLYIEVPCGSEDGLAEKKYIASLTHKFKFSYYGRPVETVKWTTKGPYTLKHLLFFHRFTSAIPEVPTMENVSDGAVKNIGLSNNANIQAHQAKVQPVTSSVQARPAASAAPAPAPVPVPAPAPPVGPIMSFPIAGMKYNLAHGKESISRSRFHEQLLHNMVSVPATAPTGYYNKSGNRAPAAIANTAKDKAAPGSSEFW